MGMTKNIFVKKRKEFKLEKYLMLGSGIFRNKNFLTLIGFFRQVSVLNVMQR